MAIPEAWIDLLDESIRHRGPDGAGRFRHRATRPDGTVVDVALVHRRLSIIDHAGGAQPMVLGRSALRADSGDGSARRADLPGSLRPCPRCAALGKTTIAVVFNGCIYNHRDLRRELRAAGHEFTTDHSDTEVLLHGWAEWGAALPRRLEAMFAVGVWDGAAGGLHLVRDRFGEKPLYTLDSPGGVTAFASTAGALLRLPLRPGDDRPADWPALTVEWLTFGHGGPMRLLHVDPVAPGRIVHRAGDGNETNPWVRRVPFGEPGPALNAGAAEAALRTAIRRRLEADVPLGCFLSGGIDSSLVALFARQEAGTLRTLCVRMPDARYDESGAAASAAGVVGSDHATVEAAPRPADDLPPLIETLGLPFGDSSLLPTYWVSGAAREHLAVALTGDGGDEMFSGYERYGACRPLRRFRWALRLFPSAVLPRREPRSRAAKLARLAAAARHRGYTDLLAVFPTEQMRRVHGDAGPCLAASFPTPDQARFVDQAFYLPYDLMTKADTASMAVALETRAPFLDSDLADAANSTPHAVMTPGGRRKGLLRDVARKYFPAEIVDRPKQGFAIPIGEWFRSDFGGMRQLLLDHLTGPEPFGPDRLGVGPMINTAFVKRMLREHDDAGTQSLWPWKGRDHARRLYMLLVLSIWAKWLARI